jgi:hypothetical protein
MDSQRALAWIMLSVVMPLVVAYGAATMIFNALGRIIP